MSSVVPPSFHALLPLTHESSSSRTQDWAAVWPALCALGPAALLESGGPIREPSRWTILAGDPALEFYEEGGRSWVREEGVERPSSLDLPGFLDWLDGRPENFQDPLRPFPSQLVSAWFGAISYEWASGGARTGSRVPGFYFFKPRRIMALDRLTKEVHRFGPSFPPLEDGKGSDRSRGPFRVGPVRPHWSRERYLSTVERVKGYIAQGDIYQANIAQRFDASWEGDPGVLYRTLREMNPAPFMGLFQGRDFTLVSSSPERLASGRGSWIETRPIAGTRPRGRDEVQDLQLKWDLKTSPKEQAEHLMLVDLARNDLGKVAQFGTVEVEPFGEVEPYAKVQHLVSVVRARKAPSAGHSGILASLFPGGTITGCPKIRCMEIIREMEEVPRGFYTGSMGYFAGGSCFDLNILIRTFTLFPDQSLEFFAGAGIVADSDPAQEYLETLYKVEALAQALGASFFPSHG